MFLVGVKKPAWLRTIGATPLLVGTTRKLRIEHGIGKPTGTTAKTRRICFVR